MRGTWNPQFRRGRAVVTAVEFRVLGGVEAEVGGARLDLGHAKQRGVLAVLLVEANRVVPAERLLDRVWGGDPPSRGRNTLYNYLSRLRAVLPAVDGVSLLRRSGGYTLAVDAQNVDLHRFRDLAARGRACDDDREAVDLLDRALGSWRGEPVSDLDTPWARDLRATLAGELLAVELDHADLALRSGRHAGLLPGLSARAARHPLDERVAAQLMLALHRDGRQADALAHYQRVRARLAEELGTDPGPPLRVLHRQILTSDPALHAERDTGRAAAAVPVPRQLPAAPPSFTGRADELAALSAALGTATSGPVPVAAVGGAGGIGKTALVLHWAHDNAHRFPDGHLFVDLHGFSPAGRPVPPEEVLGGFLAALGVAPDRVPDDRDTRAALYRSLVAGRRMLVVLDNAAGTAQVAPLLPGTPTCAVVVTGRNRLASLIDRHGARHLQLDVLTRAEAHSLLVARLGATRVAAEPDATEELVDLCGRYPLALSITARHAHTRPGVPLAEPAAELRRLGLDVLDHDDPAASLPAVLSWSLRDLTDEQRWVFTVLGVAPGPDTDLAAAAAATGLPAARARKALTALEDASLLDRRSGGRYAMHDLIRDYAATLARDLAPPVREAALRRAVDFYLHTAHGAQHLLDPHHDPVRLDPPEPGVQAYPLTTAPAAMSWLDAEYPQLTAAQRTAHAHRWYRRVWQLALTLTTFHSRRGHHPGELALWHTALDAAAHLPDPAARTHAHQFLGRAHIRLGRLAEAVVHLDRSLELARAQGSRAHQALSHRVLAEARSRGGDNRRALEHVLLALDLYRALDHPVGQSSAHADAGWVAALMGDHDVARDHCRTALALNREHRDDPEVEAHVLDSLGYVEHATGHYRQAAGHYGRALALYRPLGSTYYTAGTLERLGHTHRALGEEDRARAVWHEALELYLRQGRDAEADAVRRRLDTLG
ncbi:BTAD domain-containing putative transcriptional regulator [Actinosynnema sp. NPDC050436]|uniref:AfsR/SARP family transcriptional regulator n=1 Tax=Actinosynnema sp. NPDC050436 TaxID=3155659 RepID=UPI0033C4AEDD